MDWIKRLFSKRTRKQPDDSRPERPADWHLTLDDLFAEMKAGKRKSVGHPEAEWAKDYGRSLIPEATRFPKKGDLYESNEDQAVTYLTAWSGPFTGGGEALLFKGERIWVHSEPVEAKPLGTYARPVEYEELEERMVPREERENPKYGGFYFHFKTVDLSRKFTLVQTGFNGKDERRADGAAVNRAP